MEANILKQLNQSFDRDDTWLDWVIIPFSWALPAREAAHRPHVGLLRLPQAPLHRLRAALCLLRSKIMIIEVTSYAFRRLDMNLLEFLKWNAYKGSAVAL